MSENDVTEIQWRHACVRHKSDGKRDRRWWRHAAVELHRISLGNVHTYRLQICKSVVTVGLKYSFIKHILHYFDLLYNKSTTNRSNGIWFYAAHLIETPNIHVSEATTLWHSTNVLLLALLLLQVSSPQLDRIQTGWYSVCMPQRFGTRKAELTWVWQTECIYVFPVCFCTEYAAVIIFRLENQELMHLMILP